MKNRSFFTLTILCLCCIRPVFSLAGSPDWDAMPDGSVDTFRLIHVIVPLCDNANQGIVPVPRSLGNGQDPASNLYWGAAYGLKSWFKRQGVWRLEATLPGPSDHVLERCVFRHTASGVWMVADAWDGAYMKEALEAYISASAGRLRDTVCLERHSLLAGGEADLLAFCGHNGLMDTYVSHIPEPADTRRRDAIILACYSKDYFSPVLAQTGAHPLLWTTGLMAPEAYTLDAALQAWISRKSPGELRESAAAAYHKYQKCGMRGARNLLVTTPN